MNVTMCYSSFESVITGFGSVITGFGSVTTDCKLLSQNGQQSESLADKKNCRS